MTFKVFMTQRIELLHRTGKEYTHEISQIKRVYEGTEEYEELMSYIDEEAGENATTVEERINIAKRILKELVIEQTKQSVVEIKDVVKGVYAENKSGYLEFSGMMINPIDFSMIKIADFSVKVEVEK